MKRQLTYIKPEIEITHVETESGLLESTYIPIGGTQTGGWDAPEYNGDFDEDDFGQRERNKGLLVYWFNGLFLWKGLTGFQFIGLSL